MKNIDGLLVKPYSVRVDGFPELTYYGASPGQARAAAWRNYSESFECPFKDFLRISRVRKGVAECGFGERIVVAGQDAFRVPMRNHGHYVGFVRPGETQVHLSHPRDVEEMDTPSFECPDCPPTIHCACHPPLDDRVRWILIQAGLLEDDGADYEAPDGDIATACILSIGS